MADQPPPEREYETTCTSCEKWFRYKREETMFNGPIRKSTTAVPTPMVVRCRWCGHPNEADFQEAK